MRIMAITIALVLLAGAGALLWPRTGGDVDAADPIVASSPSAGEDPLGAFYLPGEFDRQEVLLLGGEQLAALHPDVMVEIVRHAAPEVRILIPARSAVARARIDSVLAPLAPDPAGVRIVPAPVVSMWVRDFAPFTVSDANGRRSMMEFTYRDRRGDRIDDDLPPHIAESLGLAILDSRLRLEGGDLLNNGRGLGLLSTRVVDRNGHDLQLDPRQTLQNVASLLGFEGLVLVRPLSGEPTGHADLFGAFLRPDLIVIGRYRSAADPVNAAILDATAAELTGLATLDGPLQVERIPMPGHEDGVWRTYTNLVFANEVVLVPVYPDHCPGLDTEALAIYRRLMPGRKVVGVDASGLIRTAGALRCVTMNVPAALPRDPPGR